MGGGGGVGGGGGREWGYCAGTSSSPAAIPAVRGQELYESRGGRSGLPVPNSPYGVMVSVNVKQH